MFRNLYYNRIGIEAEGGLYMDYSQQVEYLLKHLMEDKLDSLVSDKKSDENPSALDMDNDNGWWYCLWLKGCDFMITKENEYAELKAEKEKLLAEINAVTSAEQNAKLFTKLIEEYTDLQELNARILNGLIDRIVIHEKEIINGEKFQTVEIYYKFVGIV